uniref:(California timema) hypothetical protein n=1 Tax=Timema californicum TaxID=61474 RepID=A0A7R9JIC2_TIMCA|nr:unnamed protein product [Timema californicum]
MTTSFFTRRHNDTTVEDHYTLLDSLFIALSGFLCGQAQPMTPTSCSLRVLLLTIYITGWLLMALYSGKITSSLAVRKVTLPFNSMEGILADGSYQFTVLKNSVQYNILSVLRKIDLHIELGYSIIEGGKQILTLRQSDVINELPK